MVRLDRRGIGRLGCLLWVLGIVSLLYWGLPVASAYADYFRLLDEMTTQAQFAPSLEDGVIRRRLVQKAVELDLPPEASRFGILRIARPREIRISTSYSVSIELPFYVWVKEFTPRVVLPL